MLDLKIVGLGRTTMAYPPLRCSTWEKTSTQESKLGKGVLKDKWQHTEGILGDKIHQEASGVANVEKLDNLIQKVKYFM